MKEKKDYLKAMNDRIYEQVSFAETKNGFLIGLLGLSLFEMISIYINNTCMNNWVKYYFLFLLAHLFIGLLCSFFSFIPQPNKLNNECENLYFWKDISCYRDFEEYNQIMENTDENNEIKQLSEQNIFLSRIINRKIRLFQFSVNFVVSGIFPPFWIYILIKMLIDKKNKKRSEF